MNTVNNRPAELFDLKGRVAVITGGAGVAGVSPWGDSGGGGREHRGAGPRCGESGAAGGAVTVSAWAGVPGAGGRYHERRVVDGSSRCRDGEVWARGRSDQQRCEQSEGGRPEAGAAVVAVGELSAGNVECGHCRGADRSFSVLADFRAGDGEGLARA